MKTADVCRKHGISEPTFYAWKAKFGGMGVSEARRLKQLEEENARLKKLLAEAMLDNAVLMGHRCTVVAPSMVPRRPGDRIKTNRRDALQLARLLRAGELNEVWVPDESHEAVRELIRSR